ncbi:hypothetical protein AB0H49_28930 [Nocardia sp. NPDC050713]|uniref:hypothetical protein n=1 Tax=unclassified Nocardia TaxID=2637762 RepID=UPI0033ADF310
MVEAFRIGLIVFVAVLLAAGFGVLLPLRVRRRRAAGQTFSEWGTPHGWRFEMAPLVPWTARLPGRNPTGLGATLTGELGGHQVTVADYSYQTSAWNGQIVHTTTHRFVVVVVLLERPYPPVAVVDVAALSEPGSALFSDVPVTTGHRDFDHRFRVTAVDTNYARLLVGPQLIAAHLEGVVPRWSLAGHELLSYQTGRLGDPDAIPDLAAPVLHLATLIERRAH